MDHGSRVVRALEALWEQVRARHPDVPAVVMITGSAHAQRGASLYSRELGHFGPDLWTGEAGQMPELFVAGELLHPIEGQPTGHRALTTLLHEAAHGLAHVRDIKDTSRSGNRYHNKRYAALATELGLVPPAVADERGWSDCTLAPTTPDLYTDALAVLADATLAYLRDPWARLLTPTSTGALAAGADPDGDADETTAVPAGPVIVPPPRTAGGGRAGARISIGCACDPPRRLSVTPHQHEQAPILCGACEQAFDPLDDDR
jgi:hypothetical protein